PVSGGWLKVRLFPAAARSSGCAAGPSGRSADTTTAGETRSACASSRATARDSRRCAESGRCRWTPEASRRRRCAERGRARYYLLSRRQRRIDGSSDSRAGLTSRGCPRCAGATGKADAESRTGLRVERAGLVEALLRLKALQRLLRLRRHDAVDSAGI